MESAAIGGEVGTGVCLCGDGMGVAPEAAMGGEVGTWVCPLLARGRRSH